MVLSAWVWGLPVTAMSTASASTGGKLFGPGPTGPGFEFRVWRVQEAETGKG